MIYRRIILITILSGLSISNSYRILAIFPFPGFSHFHVLSSVAKSLAQKGHQIDVISQFKLEKPFPNYVELDFFEPVPHARTNFNVSSSTEAFRKREEKLTIGVCGLLGHPTVSKLMKNPPTNPPYDAVIVHVGVGIQCVMAAGRAFDVPVIGVATSIIYPMFQLLIRNPMSFAIAPGHTHYYKQNFTFWERVQNVVQTHNQLRSAESYDGLQEKLIQKYLGVNSPRYSDLHKNMALLLTNSHYSFHGIKPITPAVVEIGGINIKNDSSELSPSLKKILDDSVRGFIYFSFGTQVVFKTLPNDFLKNIISTFCAISPIKVVMRVPNADVVPDNLCDNVFTFNWLPQQKILEHSNIKAFVMHGGGLSTQETIHFAVPVICIPIAYDQYINCDIVALKNLGVKIDIQSAQQKDYANALQEILSNPKYKDAMNKFSQLYWDRPQSPGEAVTYWVEYVIRHGQNALRSPAVDLEWWQFELIDVYCFLFSCVILTVLLTIVILRHICRLISRFHTSINLVKSNKKYQ